jgi:hypothetical protein
VSATDTLFLPKVIHQIDPMMKLEFIQHAVDMTFYGGSSDVEFLGDFLVHKTLNNQLHDLPLSGRESPAAHHPMRAMDSSSFE